MLPREVVNLIDRLFAPTDWHKAMPQPSIVAFSHLSALAAVVAAVDQVPQHLLTVQGEALLRYTAGISALRSAVAAWHGGNKTYELRPIQGFADHPILLVREGLSACPPTLPEPGTTPLAFIADEASREALRQDISWANSALRNGEWKAATVLAGSVVEALLLSAIQQADRDSLEASKALARERGCNVSKGPEWWHLPSYIEVTLSLKRITEETANAARLAKDFRNLIHPGAAVRARQECDQGTAMLALAAVYLVVRDLTPKKLKREGP
jgi:hypothetical protein